jgi:hypothetical protein
MQALLPAHSKWATSPPAPTRRTHLSLNPIRTRTNKQELKAMHLLEEQLHHLDFFLNFLDFPCYIWSWSGGAVMSRPILFITSRACLNKNNHLNAAQDGCDSHRRWTTSSEVKKKRRCVGASPCVDCYNVCHGCFFSESSPQQARGQNRRKQIVRKKKLKKKKRREGERGDS